MRYQKDQRFSDEKKHTHVNQYTNQDLLDIRYRWLINQTVVSSSPLGFFKCWIINNTSGIDETESGYLRMSYRGKKILVHLFSWEYHNGSKPRDKDISHLCHNKRCCRPSHLFCESRSTNKSRDHCIGIVSPDKDSSVHYTTCNHEPICCTDNLLTICNQPKEQ